MEALCSRLPGKAPTRWMERGPVWSYLILYIIMYYILCLIIHYISLCSREQWQWVGSISTSGIHLQRSDQVLFSCLTFLFNWKLFWMFSFFSVQLFISNFFNVNFFMYNFSCNFFIYNFLCTTFLKYNSSCSTFSCKKNVCTTFHVTLFHVQLFSCTTFTVN